MRGKISLGNQEPMLYLQIVHGTVQWGEGVGNREKRRKVFQTPMVTQKIMAEAGNPMGVASVPWLLQIGLLGQLTACSYFPDTYSTTEVSLIPSSLSEGRQVILWTFSAERN